MNEETLWTAQQVAKYMGVHINTVKSIKPENLPYYRIVERGDRRYNPHEVDRYLAERRVTRKEKT